jgi:hypothetical protein
MSAILFVKFITTEKIDIDINIKEAIISDKIYIYTQLEKLMGMQKTTFEKEAILVLQNIMSEKIKNYNDYMEFIKYSKVFEEKPIHVLTIDPNLIEAIVSIYYNKPYIGQVRLPTYKWDIRKGLYVNIDLNIDKIIKVDTTFVYEQKKHLPTIYMFLLSCEVNTWEELCSIWTNLTVPKQDISVFSAGHLLKNFHDSTKPSIDSRLIGYNFKTTDSRYFENMLALFIFKNKIKNIKGHLMWTLLHIYKVDRNVVDYLDGARNEASKTAIKEHPVFNILYEDNSIRSVLESWQKALEATEDDEIEEEPEEEPIEDDLDEGDTEDDLGEDTETDEETEEEENTEDDNTIDEEVVSPEEKLEQLLISTIDLEIPEKETLEDLLYKLSVCRLVNEFKTNPPDYLTSEELLLLEYWCKFWIGQVSASNTKQLLSTIIGENKI